MAVKLLIDTSAYSAFNRGDERLRAHITPDHELLVPLIVLGELRAGFAVGGRQIENERLLQRFLDSPNVFTVTLSDQTSRHYSAVYRSLRLAGRPIGTNDMWIAAMALEHDLSLLTLDGDFCSIPDLQIITL